MKKNMFKLNVINKRKKTQRTFTFDNTTLVKNFIKNITTRDLYIKKYLFDNNEDLHYFFKQTYNKKFFEVKPDLIVLRILPNGLHREKIKTRRSFNNRTLRRLINRVLNETSTMMQDRFLKFDSSRNHYMEFVKPTKDPYIASTIAVMFDKKKWTYDFVKMTLYDEEFPKELRRKFNELTLPLKFYKEKQNK
jgi:hypothetical protein